MPGATAPRRRSVGRVPHRSGPASRRRDNRRTRASRHPTRARAATHGDRGHGGHGACGRTL